MLRFVSRSVHAAELVAVSFNGFILGSFLVGFLIYSAARIQLPPQRGSERRVLLDEASSRRDAEGEQFEATLWLCAWMLFSGGFVLFNKWLLSNGFDHPWTLTGMHMASCFAVFGAISWLPRPMTTHIMPELDKHIPWPAFLKGILPVSLLYGASLGLGNMAASYASVSFLQMVKPFNIILTSLMGFAIGVEVPTLMHITIACVIALGVSSAAFSEVDLNVPGLVLQLCACLAEALRLALLQAVMTKTIQLDPVTTVYRMSPVAGLLLLVVAYFVDPRVPWSLEVSTWLVAANCACAVVLNLLIVFVIKKTSAVVFTLGGVCKDVGTIFASVHFLGSVVTARQLCGFATSMCGIGMYKVYKDNFALFLKHGMCGGFTILCSCRGSNVGATPGK